ncbi:RNA helicase required for poly(A+) mRNA export, partial [Tulasnella sp. 408]
MSAPTEGDDGWIESVPPKAGGDAGVDLGGLSIKGAARTSDDKGKEKEKEAAAKPDVPQSDLIASTHEVVVTLADQQADPNSPLYSIKSFEDLGLHADLLKGLYSMGFQKPSKIQERALPLLLQNPPKNMIGQSQSGTGKTAAFTLAMLSRIDFSKKITQAICLAPSRELARQIMSVITTMGAFTPVTTAFAIKESVERGAKVDAQIVVGTPGTLTDLLRRKAIESKEIKIFVVDEADNMLDQQGLGDQTLRVKNMVPRTCQIVLFSATFADNVRIFAGKFAPGANEIKLKQEELSVEGIKQFYMDCASEDKKFDVLVELYSLLTIGQSMIFCKRRETADVIAQRMSEQGHQVVSLHGSKDATERDRTIDAFRDGKYKVLITTNVVARGIDILQVNMVVNYDLPMTVDNKPDVETYLHRIGRTGRFGRKGISINFVHNSKTWEEMQVIQNSLKKPIVRVGTDDFDKMEKWASGRDEEVQVNQRALIDKVLARYSGEHTVLRELLQNSDDAGAKTVEIHFNTGTFLKRRGPKNDSEQPASGSDSLSIPSSSTSQLPDLTKEPLHQWEFRNDGIPFREEDWNRLKKIAEGNPDEEKIGAFGVGFYSLFSVTDEPFVTSGDQWMGFYWKDNKDQLFARRGTLPPVEPSAANEKQWTTFAMPLREASPFPGRPVDIARFLATSLTFMRNLCDVSMFFNEHRLVRIKKNAGHPKPLTLPSSSAHLDPRTRIAGTMTVKEVQSSDLRMQAQVLRWVYSTGSEKAAPKVATVVSKPAAAGGFFASIFSSFASGTSSPAPRPSTPVPATPPADPLETVDSSVILTVYSAKVESKLDQKSMAELERATKKKPPTMCWYSLIYTGKDEFDMSQEEDQKEFKATGSVFQGLRADLDGTGTARVFIGHATSQSTGIGGHISARFIPTVERESIDLVDRQVSVWNKELLWVGGYLCRFIYESQLATIRTLWDEAVKSQKTPGEGISATAREWLESKALHTLKFFTFHPTTPSAVVGLNMEAAFFACARDKGAFPIISSTGVKPASQVRSYSPEYGAFLKNTPMLTESVIKAVPLT